MFIKITKKLPHLDYLELKKLGLLINQSLELLFDLGMPTIARVIFNTIAYLFEYHKV